ncbi:adhesion G protein-coupled receptor B3-like isoform X2 [Mercenaria mercenaria]|uniref:adhesion G protein-coupled receptor B3-like isoform X2 n=1 Tax=Mercenaria mercenaria TaxID=6596 RepID=UPI00234EBC94|nr:adhesion G protein-coupled receptor B3-like isoform X2 [Mercenaria mercenaria]
MERKQTIICWLMFYTAAVTYGGYRETRSGTWDGINISCGQPSTPAHGEVSLPNGTRYGAMVHYSCYAGYNLVGNAFRKCLHGNWGGTTPKCVKDCDNGNYGDTCEENCSGCNPGTTCNPMSGSCSEECSAGYQGIKCLVPCRNGTFEIKCQHKCECATAVSCNKTSALCYCGKTVPENGKTRLMEGSKLLYTCNAGFKLVGHETRTCNRFTESWDYPAPLCVKKGVVVCPDEADYRGTVWKKTGAGKTSTTRCPRGSSGIVTRTCQTDGTWNLPIYNCIRGTVEKVHIKAETLKDNATAEELGSTLQTIASLTCTFTQQNTTLDESSKLTAGELNLLSVSLQKIASVLSTWPDVVNHNITNAFLDSASNLIDDTYQLSWKALKIGERAGAVNVLSAVESFGKSLGRSLGMGEDLNQTIVKTNIAMEVTKVLTDDITFPDQEYRSEEYLDWVKNTKSNIRLSSTSFRDLSVQYISTAIMYRNMSEIFPSKTKINTNSYMEKNRNTINGQILSLSISPPLTDKLDPPIYISFQHINNELTEPSCRYWRFRGNSDGYWSNTGCSVHFSNTTYTVCECNHLTNFAVLMSPFKEADADSLGLQIVSFIGIGVSISCLLATLAIHVLLWKYLKSDRTALLANLCIALVLSYILFLAGVDRTENTVVCTVIAACLHYIYLVVFSIMLAEGIEMAITVLYVFKTKTSRIRWLLLMSWLLPAIIVGISLGVTKTEGFGNKKVCWLSNEKGLIWAFVGPTLAVILFNTVCLVVVVRAVFRSRTIEAKEYREKVKDFSCFCSTAY